MYTSQQGMDQVRRGGGYDLPRDEGRLLSGADELPSDQHVRADQSGEKGRLRRRRPSVCSVSLPLFRLETPVLGKEEGEEERGPGRISKGGKEGSSPEEGRGVRGGRKRV